MKLVMLIFIFNAALAFAGDLNHFDEIPFYDFSDSFYLSNGVDPTKIYAFRIEEGPLAVVENSPNPDIFRNLRVNLHIPAYAHNGDPVFFSVFGEFSEAAFTNDEAGIEAREIAEKYPVYIFPMQSCDPPNPFCKRQNDIMPVNDGYWSGDPLGLWLIVFVRYTNKAFDAAEGQEALADLMATNGPDLDGTPTVRTEGELEDLLDSGLVEFITRSPAEERYSICPAMKDPRNGAVTSDAILASAMSPGEGELVMEWECLQQTGNWC